MKEDFIDTSSVSERFILIAVNTKNGEEETAASLDELAELTVTLGASVCGTMTQNMESVHPGHYFGKGKLLELKALIEAADATGVIADDELSPAQYKNMESILDTKIIDRTALILDIFAMNAKSAEGIAQVELAQLNYRLSRLAGLGKSLSRLGGGIGTRGPGEKKLETDRRHIRNRINTLNGELKEISARRGVLRHERERSGLPKAALVGYTNAGKSTVMNLLSGSDVLAQDALFATLDTTTRRAALPGGGEFLLTDTVGFIQKLPHQLIKAFRATLSELEYADFLIHVVDSSRDFRAQTDVVYKTLRSLNISGKPIIAAYNKADKTGNYNAPADAAASASAALSALTGAGADSLLQAIECQIKKLKKEITALIPFKEGALLNLVHKNGEIISQSYEEGGTLLNAYVPPEIAQRLDKFLCG